MNPNISTISRVFESCTTCDKKMKQILIPMSDMIAIKEFEKKERLCRECAKESKFTDDVITIDLRKRGII